MEINLTAYKTSKTCKREKDDVTCLVEKDKRGNTKDKIYIMGATGLSERDGKEVNKYKEANVGENACSLVKLPVIKEKGEQEYKLTSGISYEKSRRGVLNKIDDEENENARPADKTNVIQHFDFPRLFK